MGVTARVRWGGELQSSLVADGRLCSRRIGQSAASDALDLEMFSFGMQAYGGRIIADLRVRKFEDGSCLDIIGAGAQDLTGRQKQAVLMLTAPPGIPAVLSSRHAEVTVLNAARI